MKKRLLSLLLALGMLIGLFPIITVETWAAEIGGSKIEESYNTCSQPASDSTRFSTAYVRNTGATSTTRGTPRSLEVVVNNETFNANDDIYVVMFRAEDVNTALPAGVTALTNDSYMKLPLTGADRTNAYGMGRKRVANGTAAGTQTVPIVAPSEENHAALGNIGAVVSNKAMAVPSVGDKSESYYLKYEFIVFGGDKSGDVTNYYVDYFYLDSEGYVCTPSYAVRYNGNNPPHTSGYTNNVNMGNVPKLQIQRAAWTDTRGNAASQVPGDMTLSDKTPARTGYEFVGWTTQALDPLEEGVTAPANGSKVTSGGKSATFYATKGTFPQPSPLYSITDLYALWRKVPVKFSHDSQVGKYTIAQEEKGWVMSWLEPIPQVGVNFDTKNIAFAQGPGGKIYNVVTYEDGKQIHNSGAPTVNPPVSKYTLAVKTGSTNGNWSISGTPEDHSDTKTVELVITVTDVSNDTHDTITVRFPQVKKGAQPIPTEDKNTGLQSRVQTTGEGGAPLETPDGQIYGFYSSGAVLNAADGYTSDKDGTGTMTNWYLNMGMVFEYMPHMLKDADGTLQLFTGDTGWREVPFPETWYASLDATGKADLAASMESGATKRIVSTKAGDKKSAITASADNEAWPASYGSITFENGLPVIHGLHEDDVYLVRFRANDQYEVSDHREITIGGAVSGGGETPVASGGLAVNLAGGSEKEDPGGYSALKTAAKNLSADGELDLNVYDFEPTREGSAFLGWTLGERDTDGNLILYRADEPQTITVTWVDHDGTVLAGPVTMEVGGTVPDHPADPTREGYTFKEWTRSEDTEGNITFTATYTEVTEPEPTPEATPGPEARDGEGEGTDPGGEEPPPAAVAAKWVDGLTGETILEGTTETEAPKKPFHSCYTAADAWTESPGEDGTVTYTISYTRNTKVPMPEDLPASLAAVWQGGSSDPADPSDFVTVVCYDWDNTLLGSVTVPKGAEASVVEGYMNDFVRTLQSPESKDVDASKGSYFVDDAKFPMTYKRGYSFNCWLPYDSTLPTHCGRAVNGDNRLITIEDPLEEGTAQAFSGLEANITVKACYKDNSELHYTTSAASMPYTLEVVEYNRVGTTVNYVITYRFLRQTIVEQDGEKIIKGVPRLVEPQLRVIFNGNIYNFFALGSSDEETFTIYPHGTGITSIGATMVDFYQASVKTNASGKANVATDTNGASATDQNGFRLKGTLKMANELLADGSSSSLATLSAAVLRNQLGLTYSGSVGDARNNLRKAWLTQNSVDGTETTIKPESEWKDLSQEQMNYALANGGALQP